jgi:AbrB family looped-hinge helix DNA binding protein
MGEATLSSKYQIVIPREARHALGLKPGDKFLVVIRGNHLIVMPKAKSFAKAPRGIARGVYPEGYLQKERESWEQFGIGRSPLTPLDRLPRIVVSTR